MKDICNKYAIKISKDISEIVFLYNGNQLKEDLTFIEQANKYDKERNKMTILVTEIDSEATTKEKEKIKHAKDILCPECGDPIKVKFENYKVKLDKCKNAHADKMLLLSEFKNLITIDESKIICDLCKEVKKSETFKNIFYYCFTCNQKFCPICKSKHEKNNEHGNKIIDFDLRNYFCKEHNEQYISYCNKCAKNICLKCTGEHGEHDIINYQNILPKEEEKLKELEKLRNKIDQMSEYLNEVINIFKEVIKNYEILYDIEKYIIDNYNIKNINYEILSNIREIDNNEYFNDLDKINDNNVRINDIIEIYKNFVKEENLQNLNKKQIIATADIKDDGQKENVSGNNRNEIYIKYKVNDSSDTLRIFGDKFVENNKDKCSIEYKSASITVLPVL